MEMVQTSMFNNKLVRHAPAGLQVCSHGSAVNLGKDVMS
jgi:hypothetical protein